MNTAKKIRRMWGTVRIAKLDNELFKFIYEKGIIYLRGELRLSDRRHQLAAYLIAKEFNVVVVWQSMDGRKHRVTSESNLAADCSLLQSVDPRESEYEADQYPVH